MELIQKKRLAELIGFKEQRRGLMYKKPNGKYGDFVSWNPDKNEHQFKYVLERLTQGQSRDVVYRLTLDFQEYSELRLREVDFNDLVEWLWISKHMPEVIQVVLKVIG